MKTKTASFPVHRLAFTAVMAAVLCVLGPLSVPVGPIPFSFATLGIYLVLYPLGWRWGTASVLVYVLLGTAGLPVFSGFSGGLGKLLGPTGGYIAGYLFLAVIAGAFIQHGRNRFIQFLGMLLGTAVLYAFGTAWFCLQGGFALGVALQKCVWIFIPGDLAKMAIAVVIGPLVRRRLDEAGLR